MLRNAMLAVGCMLALAACTPSETACLIVDEAKLTFDDFAADGRFSADDVVTVNAIYIEARRVCDAPPGTYDNATVIRTAGSVARTIRRIMSDQPATVTVVMYPKLEKLERMLQIPRE